MKSISLCLLLIGQLLLANAAYAAKTDAELRARSIDASRTLESRIRALKKLYKHMLVDGEIPSRTTCVWDVLGRQGPIYASTIDMQVRFKFYGINMDIVAYTDENEAVKALEEGRCDSAIISGAKANKFNKFTGSIEALGGLTSKAQMSLLLQVLSSSRAMPKMQNDEYIIIGVIPIGENFLMSRNDDVSDLTEMMSGTGAIVTDDVSHNALFNSFNTKTEGHAVTAKAARAFNAGKADVMLSPKVAYNMFNLGDGLKNGAILDYPLSQMTLQIVGRVDRIPPEVALILREDLFIKFNYLYREVNKNNRNIPKKLFKDISVADKALLDDKISSIRKEQKLSGNYHKSMLKLQGKIRCKLDRTLPECQK